MSLVPLQVNQAVVVPLLEGVLSTLVVFFVVVTITKTMMKTISLSTVQTIITMVGQIMGVVPSLRTCFGIICCSMVLTIIPTTPTILTKLL